MDLKALKSALTQLEEERGVPQEKILGAIEDALVAAYKKDYGKRDQIVRAKFDLDSGKTEFYQVKIVVDESLLLAEGEGTRDEGRDNLEAKLPSSLGSLASKLVDETTPKKIRFN